MSHDVFYRCDTQCGRVCICAALERFGLSAVRALTCRNIRVPGSLCAMSSTHRSSSATTSRANRHEDVKRILRAEMAERGQLMFDKGEMSRWIKASESRVVRRTVRDSRGNASAAPRPEKVLQVILQRWREALLRGVVHWWRKRVQKAYRGLLRHAIYKWRKVVDKTPKGLLRRAIYEWRKVVDETPITFTVEKIFLCYAPVRRKGIESVSSSSSDEVGQARQSKSI